MSTIRRNGIHSLLLLGFCASASIAPAQTYEVFHTFVLPGGHPTGPVVASPLGVLYGTTTDAGVYERGSVFAMNPDGSGGFTYQTLHSFVGPEGASPHAGLIFGVDGNLYGTAIAGGATGVGTLFRISPAGEITRLHDFADGGGEQPSELFLASDGSFYGTTRAGGAHGGGTVFRLGADEIFSTVHDFDGAVEGTQPLAAPVQSGSFLYGTTNLGGANGIGTIYKVDMATGETSKVYDFDAAVGANPAAALMRASDGNLYGTAARGGNIFGSVFKMDASETVTLLYAFNYNPDGREPVAPLIQLSDAKLYGTTDDGGAGAPPNTVARGSVFRIDTLGNFEWLGSFYADLPPPPPSPLASSLASPANTPYSAVTDGHDGFLYGTVAYPYGAVYRISPTNPQPPTFPHVFGTAEGPYYPEGPLTEANGALYTTASASTGPGSLLRFDGPNMTVLHDFVGVDGANPTTAALLLASDGGLYGTTPNGGYGPPGNWGNVYRLTSGGAFESLHIFQPPEGAQPTAGFLESPAGQFWGVASAGGTSNMGTVFRIDSAGTFSLLHQFYGPDGNGPFSGFALGSDAKLYGTTANGGPSDDGTIFTMDSLGAFTSNVYDFDGLHGVHPFAGLLRASDGSLYGMASRGGTSDAGVIFRFDGSSVTSVHDFDGTDGSTPLATLIQASDGKLYGTTTWGGAYGFGNIFRMDILGTTFESLHDFVEARPQASLMQASDGALYSSAGGGYANAGILFRLVLGDATPLLTATEPSSGRAAGGTLVAVTGNHLTGVSGVSIGGIAATPPAQLDQSAVYTVSPALTPGTLNDVTVELPTSKPAGGTLTLPAVWFADFNDVAGDDIFHSYVEAIFRAGITAGCSGGNYCRNDAVRRDQMAVFLLKAEHGSDYVPPACAGLFPDVACPSQFADWIERLAAEGVTAGCGGGNYCPGSPVTRAQMSVFLLKTKEGSSYVPPAAAGIFGDVPPADPFAPWIEELSNRGITAGCQGSPPLYCPASPNTRGQMAVFLVKTFGL